jgi:hypothetical protein
MKIQVIKAGSRSKPQGYCGCFVDDFAAKPKK